jgi:hypothetical protein
MSYVVVWRIIAFTAISAAESNTPDINGAMRFDMGGAMCSSIDIVTTSRSSVVGMGRSPDNSSL